jgi:hypothetical protein
MGNEIETAKMKQTHEREITRIKNIDNENERKAEIERLALENGYKLDIERINELAEYHRMQHEENVTKLENEREYQKNLVENERN